jgi:hypothetical protein
VISRRDKLQIVFGLLCSSDGCPVAVEVFGGNVADPATLSGQVAKLKQRFHLDRVVLVGDRGLASVPANVRIYSPPPEDRPGKGRQGCHAPAQAAAWCRSDRACRRRRAQSPQDSQHFTLTITEDHFAFVRNQASIEAESQLDGIYVIRTNLAADDLAAPEVVRSYKDLSRAERAFRSLKTVDLEIRPIHHRLPDRVRAHVLLCMLAYYVEWHMRQVLAPVLFDDHQRDEAAAARTSIVAPAQRSTAARRKAANKVTEDGLPVLSFQSLLAELATFTRNTMALASRPKDNFLLYPQVTPLQRHAFDLLATASRL